MSGEAPATAAPREPWTVHAARWMVLLVLVGLTITPPLAVLGQIVLVALYVLSGELRRRFVAACRQPLGLAALLLLLVIALGVPFSAAGMKPAVTMLWGWRKLLMVPVALAVFDTRASKILLLRVFIVTCVVLACVSYWAFVVRKSFPIPDPSPGIVARNHSTQGAIFTLGAFAAVALTIFTTTMPRWLRVLHLAAAAFLVSNIVSVTSGRTGYVVLMICAAAAGIGWAISRGIRPRGVALTGAAIAALILVLLLAVPASRERIDIAVSEMQTYQQETEIRSMGIRMVFWSNAISLVRERPLLGWGTGAFETAYKTRVQGVPGVAGTVTRDPHNQYLAIAGENGLVGLAALLWFIACAFRQRPSPMFSVLGLGALAAWCATSMANSHFATFGEGTLLYTWLGALLARERESGTESRPDRGFPLSRE